MVLTTYLTLWLRVYVAGGKKSSPQCARAKTPWSHQRELSEPSQCSPTLAERPHRKVNIGMSLTIYHFCHKFPKKYLSMRCYDSMGTNWPCVYLSITSGCSIETGGRVELLFGRKASVDLSYMVYKDIKVSRKINVLASCLWNCFLSSWKVDVQGVINWTVIGHKLTIPPTSDTWRL